MDPRVREDDDSQDSNFIRRAPVVRALHRTMASRTIFAFI
jgi:hypothetical protein